jgi:hypothetical protein
MMYRILQIRNGHPTTLFHGVDGSRTLPVGQWIQAEVEEVFDGSGGTTYQSGFHLMPTREGAVEYLRQFDRARPLVVCEVEARNTWEKSHSLSEVLLAEEMKIGALNWLMAGNPIGSPSPIGQEDQEDVQQVVTSHLDSSPANVSLSPQSA